MRVLPILILCVSLFFISCKKCDPTNSVGGEVIEAGIVRVPGNNAPVPLMIRAANEVDFPIEVSFDNGFTYTLVDFSKYSVFALPTLATCSSGYDRVVEFNASTATAKYTLTITECPTCEGTTKIENWIVTNRVPMGLNFDFQVIKQ